MPSHSTQRLKEATPENTVRALGNAGVCITSAGKNVLVDALNQPCQGQEGIYRTIDPALATALVQGSPPLDAGVMLITHNHSDHFSPVHISNFIHHQPKVPVASCAQVVDKLPQALCSHTKQTTALHPPLYHAQSCVLSGVPVTAVSLVHMGKQYAAVTNLGFIIPLDKSYVHTGDAAPTAENMHALAQAGGKGAVLIAPFPYLTLPHAFTLVQEILAPEHVLITHLPVPDGTENGPMGWLRALRNAQEKHRHAGFPITVMETENTLYTIT